MEFDTTALIFAVLCCVGFAIIGLLIRIVSLHEVKRMSEDELHALAKGLYGRRYNDKQEKYHDEINKPQSDRFH